MFVWVFHRVSGLALIVLMLLQITSGFFQSSALQSEGAQAVAKLHNNPLLNCVLVFCFVFHSLYGVRTILMDLGVRRAKALFWIFTSLGSVLFVVFCILFFTVIS